MLRNEVQALCDVMGATLKVMPMPYKRWYPKNVYWKAYISHPKFLYTYWGEGCYSNHEAATVAYECFMKNIDKDEKEFNSIFGNP